jgi:hypothetical protein
MVWQEEVKPEHNQEVMNVVWVLIICFTVAIYGIAFFEQKKKR